MDLADVFFQPGIAPDILGHHAFLVSRDQVVDDLAINIIGYFGLGRVLAFNGVDDFQGMVYGHNIDIAFIGNRLKKALRFDLYLVWDHGQAGMLL